MIHSLNIKNFTEFEQAQFDFSNGLNVIIGDNSTGKSHLLKLAYAITSVWHEAKAEQEEIPGHISSGGSDNWWQHRLAEKLVKVFKPDKLGHLHRFGQGTKTEIQATLKSATENEEISDDAIKFQFSDTSKTKVKLLQKPIYFPATMPIFLPEKEVLSWYPGFTGFYKKHRLAIDETYYDLCEALSYPLLEKPSTQLIEPLEHLIGGQVKLEFDRFYIHYPKQGNREISLIAEGLRKIALLTYLIANDSVKTGTTLFWDEPETNLNPRIMKQVADLLIQLVKNGVQIILTTHYLFLMKELSLQVTHSKENIPAQFFSLAQQKDEVNHVKVESGKTLPDLQTIVALDEELAFFDREQAAFYAVK
jgi:AAA15 family ATPase/GTPase